MRFGLGEHDLETLTRMFAMFPEIEEVVIFGSRAKGTYKPGSDVDLALKGKTVTAQTVTNLSMQLNEESLLPYFFDVVNLAELKNEQLAEHIKRVGQTLYQV